MGALPRAFGRCGRELVWGIVVRPSSRPSDEVLQEGRLVQWLNNLRIGTKLLSSYVLLLLLMGGVGYLGASNMSVINDLQTGIYRDNLLPISRLGDG